MDNNNVYYQQSLFGGQLVNQPGYYAPMYPQGMPQVVLNAPVIYQAYGMTAPPFHTVMYPSPFNDALWRNHLIGYSTPAYPFHMTQPTHYAPGQSSFLFNSNPLPQMHQNTTGYNWTIGGQMFAHQQTSGIVIDSHNNVELITKATVIELPDDDVNQKQQGVLEEVINVDKEPRTVVPEVAKCEEVVREEQLKDQENHQSDVQITVQSEDNQMEEAHKESMASSAKSDDVEEEKSSKSKMNEKQPKEEYHQFDEVEFSDWKIERDQNSPSTSEPVDIEERFSEFNANVEPMEEAVVEEKQDDGINEVEPMNNVKQVEPPAPAKRERLERLCKSKVWTGENRKVITQEKRVIGEPTPVRSADKPKPKKQVRPTKRSCRAEVLVEKDVDVKEVVEKKNPLISRGEAPKKRGPGRQRKEKEGGEETAKIMKTGKSGRPSKRANDGPQEAKSTSKGEPPRKRRK